MPDLQPNLNNVFSKCVTVAEDGTVKFSHGKNDYHLKCEAFTPGLTYLINSAMEVERGGVQVGKATRV